jgi:hypothetical protein
VDIALFWSSDVYDSSFEQTEKETQSGAASLDMSPHEQDFKEAQAWLRGTELERQIQGLDHSGVSLLVGSSNSDAEIRIDVLPFYGTGQLTQEAVRHYYVDVAEPLLTDCYLPTSLQGFYRAYSLVSSRAFHVDAFHGLAMVPIADA